MIRNTFKPMLDNMEISILEASRRTGISRGVLGRVYRNEITQIAFDTIDRICEGLEVDMTDWLVYIPELDMTTEDIEQDEYRKSFASKVTQEIYKRRKKGDDSIN